MIARSSIQSRVEGRNVAIDQVQLLLLSDVDGLAEVQLVHPAVDLWVLINFVARGVLIPNAEPRSGEVFRNPFHQREIAAFKMAWKQEMADGQARVFELQ